MEEQTIRWVKASERIPKDGRDYIYRYIIISEGTCCDIGTIILTHGGSHMIKHALESKTDREVEWLEDSSSSSYSNIANQYRQQAIIPYTQH